MLSKFSVKKPFTVVVAVIMVFILGAVSFMNMTTDLLPSIELPYVVVSTTYVGASPEKVESSVTKPMESALSTLSGVKSVSSISSENASIVMLEFEQGTNMDSASIEISNRLDQVKAKFDDGVGSPTMMRISPDMMPVMVASVDAGGKSVEEVTKLVNDTVLPALQRVDGVGSVTASGLVEQQLKITLDQGKIDELNDRVLQAVDAQLYDAKKELDDAQAKLDEGRQQLESGQEGAVSQLTAGSVQVDSAVAQLNALLAEDTILSSQKAGFETERAAYAGGLKQAQDGLAEAQAALTQLQQSYEAVNTGLQGLESFASTPTGAALFPNGLPASTVEELLALSPEEFEAFRTAVSSIPTLGEAFASLTQDGLRQMTDGIAQLQETVDSLPGTIADAQARITEIDTELQNIKTRQATLAAMRPQLEEQLKAAQDGYEQLESGKLTAGSEFAQASAQIVSGQSQLDAAKAEFEQARDQALEKADISGVVTQEMISQILTAQNFNMPAGYLDSESGQQYLVKVGEQYGSIEELQDSVLFSIGTEGIGDIRLSDVASVEQASNAGEAYAKVNGNEGVVLSFQKQSTASTATVSQRINEAIGKLQSENPDLHIIPLMDQGDYINMIIQSVLQNLILGGILAILVLALFLRDVKPTVIIAFSIPISVLFAMVLMYFTDITLNIISLSGLALGVGMLVDNSIVVIENIYRLRNQGVPAAKAAVKGATQVAGAIFASTLTTICVFLPIVFTQGISRELFTDMGLTIAYSLLASLVVALTLVPAMGSTMLRKTKEKKHRWFEGFTNGYEKVLRFSLKHKIVVIAGVLALLVFAVFEAVNMGTAFMPEMDSPQMMATMEMPKEATQQEGYEMADEVMSRIGGLDDVETVGAISGGMSMSSSSSGSTYSFYILLKENGRTRSNAQMAELITGATQDLDCELSVSASTMDMSALGGSGISLEVKGDDVDTLNDISQDLVEMLSGIEGTTEVTGGITEGDMETRIAVDKNKAMEHGLTVAQVYQEIAAALQTEATATTLTIGSDDLPVIVVKSPEDALTREGLMSHEISVTNQQTGETEAVPLHEIAEAQDAESVSSINRENQVRYMTVTAGVDNDHNIGLVSRELEEKLAAYEVPEGYTVEIQGETETINSAMNDLILMIVLAVVFIYLIMVAQFQSLLSPFIVMFTIPLAFTGGLLALWLTGSPISIIAMLGFLMLAGVVVNNGIVFVDYVNQLRLEGVDKKDALIQTGRTRLRPILMTALTTILAMVTMALGLGDGAEMTQPMAIVTIGGLTYATLLTLLVVPVLYDVFHKRPMKKVDLEDDLS